MSIDFFFFFFSKKIYYRNNHKWKYFFVLFDFKEKNINFSKEKNKQKYI